MSNPVYRPATFGLIRLSVSAPHTSFHLPVDLDPEDRHRAGELTAYLQALLGDPVLSEAVDVSSSSLARDLNKLLSGDPVPFKKLRRLAYAATKYHLRMSHRPTPFGLMAGVAPVSFGPGHDFRFGGQWRKFARPDMEWLLGLVMRMERDPAVLPHLRVVANNFAFVRGDRLVLAYVRDVNENGIIPRTREISVVCTPAVQRALELVRRPLGHIKVVDELLKSFPGATRQPICDMLDQLIEQEFLLTDLRPPQDSSAPLRHVLDKLAPIGHRDDVRELHGIESALKAYSSRPLGKGLPEFHALTSRMRQVHDTEHLVQVDLRAQVEAQIPNIVPRELAAAASALWRISPDPIPDYFRDYHTVFVDRYGYGHPVPLAELLDPERGLDAPATFYRPPSERRADLRQRSYPARQEILTELLLAAHQAERREVVVDDALIARLADDMPLTQVAGGFDMCATLLGDSLETIAAGDFRLVALRGLGGPQVGALFGRFLHMLDDTVPKVRQLAGEQDALPVHVRFQPNDSRSGNVSQVPRVLDRAVVLGGFAEFGDDHVHGLDDLLIVARDDHFAVFSASLRREILPMFFHMLNPITSQPNAARFLGEIAQLRRRPIRRWEWTGLEKSPFLPRVRYGRTVLASARWLASSRLRDTSLSWEEWRVELRAWRERWGVPDQVEITSDDQRLTVDLTSTLHQRMLRRELRGDIPPTITELPGGGEYGAAWSGGLANEITVPMVPVQNSRTAVRAASPMPVARSRPHQPGGEWVYAKLYLTESGQEELLCEQLPSLLDDVRDVTDRWFYIRFRDPDPHIRIRFHGHAETLNGRLLPLLHDWATATCDSGLMRKMSLDTYEPEQERYGGHEALEAAESAFAADSEATLRQLVLLREGSVELDPLLVAAASCLDICLRLSEGDEWQNWFLDSYPRGRQHSAFQERRSQAVRLLDPTGRWQSLAAESGGERVLATWGERAPALRLYGKAVRGGLFSGVDERLVGAFRSVLHMHCNRFLGIDPEREQAVYSIARGAVAAFRDRSRAGR